MHFGLLAHGRRSRRCTADDFLLDVREDDEWEAGHAEGALHIPMSEFVARFGELTEAAAEDGRVHVMCRVGGRSAQVTQYLVQQGIDAVNVDGGMQAWEAAGPPRIGRQGRLRGGRLAREAGRPGGREPGSLRTGEPGSPGARGPGIPGGPEVWELASPEPSGRAA